MANYNEVRTSNWVLRLPADWSSTSNQDRGFYFESRDGTKGVYIATHLVAPDHAASVVELAEWFVAAEMSVLQTMDDFTWKIAERKLDVAPEGCVAVLDSVAPAQQYRVMAKILSRPGQVVRASFHDYQCLHYDDSWDYFSGILESLSFVEPAAESSGKVLH